MRLKDFFLLMSHHMSSKISLPTFYIEYLALHQYLGQVQYAALLLWLIVHLLQITHLILFLLSLTVVRIILHQIWYLFHLSLLIMLFLFIAVEGADTYSRLVGRFSLIKAAEIIGIQYLDRRRSHHISASLWRLWKFPIPNTGTQRGTSLFKNCVVLSYSFLYITSK